MRVAEAKRKPYFAPSWRMNCIESLVRLIHFPMTTTPFDVNKHSLVPKHSLLSEKEQEQLLTLYNINFVSLPKIMRNDPAIKSLGAKSGEVIKIVRISETAGKSIYYRGVISE